MSQSFPILLNIEIQYNDEFAFKLITTTANNLHLQKCITSKASKLPKRSTVDENFKKKSHSKCLKMSQNVSFKISHSKCLINMPQKMSHSRKTVSKSVSSKMSQSKYLKKCLILQNVSLKMSRKVSHLKCQNIPKNIFFNKMSHSNVSKMSHPKCLRNDPLKMFKNRK